VISASRTRDLVHRCPDLLAAMLRGEVEVRPGRFRPPERLGPDALGALVLWTKQPAPLVEHADLRRVIADLVAARVVVDVQLTVTGFGGSPVEPGIPEPAAAAASLARAIDAGLVDPRAVCLRLDPVATVGFEGGPVYGNARLEVLAGLLDAFAPLGVGRATASRLDDRSYPAVRRRMSALGARLERLDDAAARALMDALAAAARARGMTFHTCVDPPDDAPAGCIDGRLYNRLLVERGADFRVDEEDHNERGAQRRGCRCTYSLDVAASKGVRTCMSGGFGCIYCYAHGARAGASVRAAVARALGRARNGPDTCPARLER
jgi:hypothetical protein